MSNLKLTGVEITGVKTQQFNYSAAPSGAGTYTYGLNTVSGYRIVSIGWSWTPDTPGDRLYVNALRPINPGGGGSLAVEVEGSGTLSIFAQAVENLLEYNGQASPGFSS